MDTRSYFITAAVTFLLFCVSIILAFIWFDWKFAVVVLLAQMAAAGNALFLQKAG